MLIRDRLSMLVVAGRGFSFGGPVPMRARLAGAAGYTATCVSRLTGWGRGSTVGGRVALAVDPAALRRLGAWRTTLVIVGTNGKTTTNLLVTAALSELAPVAANGWGSNKRHGVVAALVDAPRAPFASLEIAEGDAPSAIAELEPAVVIALNLSHEQTDRADGLRSVELALRKSFSRLSETTVVANCDDVDIVSAAWDARHVIWVACGAPGVDRAVGCPRCGGPIDWATTEAAGPAAWSCTRCVLTRPTPDWTIEGRTLSGPGGLSATVDVRLPGRANLGNAAQAIAAAVALGVDPLEAVRSVSSVGDVAGRYQVAAWGGHLVRPMMAKNPVGAEECLSVAATDGAAVVVAVNGRAADGRDPSWLWDVDFSCLSGEQRLSKPPPTVIASGDRATDLSLRLFHAGVDHEVENDVAAAIRRCPAGRVDVLADYTVMEELIRVLDTEATAVPETTVAGDVGPSERDAPVVRARWRDRNSGTGTSAVRIGLVLPDILGAGGYGGNAVVLRERLRRRGLSAAIIPTTLEDPVPSALDIYIVGGPLRAELVLACDVLRRHRGLSSVVERGSPVLAAGGGLHILASRFALPNDCSSTGLGLLDCHTVAAATADFPALRAVAARPLIDGLTDPVIGFENPGVRTILGPGAEPFAEIAPRTALTSESVRLGREGAVQGSVVGTHLHGPVLAYNPQLADLLCARALGLSRAEELPALDLPPVSRVRVERLWRPGS